MKKSVMPAAGAQKLAGGSKVMAPMKPGKAASSKSVSGSKGSKKGC